MTRLQNENKNAQRLRKELEATQRALHNTRALLRGTHIGLLTIRESLAAAASQLDELS